MRRTPIAARIEVPRRDEDLPGEHRHGEPGGHGAVDEDPADGDEEQEAVGDRVEQLAELGHLVEVPGDVAVEEVGDAEHGQQAGRRGPVLLDEEEPQEDRKEQESDERDDVRHGEDPIGLLIGPLLLLHHLTLRCRSSHRRSRR